MEDLDLPGLPTEAEINAALDASERDLTAGRVTPLNEYIRRARAKIVARDTAKRQEQH